MPRSRPFYLRLPFLIMVIALCVVGYFVWNHVQEGEQRGVAFTFVEVDEGSLTQSVRATGSVSPVREIQVGSQISGIIEELLVDFNSEVSKGQLIARLDTATFDANVALAEAEKRSAEAVLELARLREGRLASLQERNMTSQEELERATLERRQAESQFDIRKGNLDKALLELERCFIVSPTDGIVISRNVDVGQTVAASLSAPILFEIADDLTLMQIITNVAEADIGRLEVGQRVEFRVDAYREMTFPGKVIQIRNAPQVIDNVVTYDTVVAVDNSDLKLKPGMTAEVFIITEEVSDTLRVRNAALRARLPASLQPDEPRPADTSESARPVFLMTPSGELTTRWVETGISDGIHTEILSGLAVGDRLVTGLQLDTSSRSGGSGRSLLGGNQAQF